MLLRRVLLPCALLTFALVPIALLSGCHGSTTARPAGADIPTVSSNSVALPGANDAADAPHAPSVTELGTSSLTTYRDPASGVSFRYPTVWRPATGQDLPAPAFAATAGKPRITQEFRPEGTVYAATVLRGLTFSYTVLPGGDASTCAAQPSKASPGASSPATVTYNGVPYTEVHGGDAAMCTYVDSAIDSTLHGGSCFVFERDVVTSCPYVKTATSPRPLTGSENEALRQRLGAVMQSVTLAPPR